MAESRPTAGRLLSGTGIPAIPCNTGAGRTDIFVRVDTSPPSIYLSSALNTWAAATVVPAWGAIIGTLSAQTDLQNALNLKANLISPSFTTPTLGVASATSLTTTGGPVVSNTYFQAAAASPIFWNTRAAMASPADGQIKLSNNVASGCQALVLGANVPSTIGATPAQGQTLSVLQAMELLTIAAAPTTVSAMSIPAGAIVLSVSVRVTTVIPTAATFTVIGNTTTTVFNTAAVSTAATSTDVGTAAGAFYNAAAQTIRVTPNLTPATATGVVRITVSYILVTPPTS